MKKTGEDEALVRHMREGVEEKVKKFVCFEEAN